MIVSTSSLISSSVSCSPFFLISNIKSKNASLRFSPKFNELIHFTVYMLTSKIESQS